MWYWTKHKRLSFTQLGCHLIATRQVIEGWFVQDNAPIDFAPALPQRFGLANDKTWADLTGFLNQAVPDDLNTEYKLVFFGRHGQGYHNVAEAKYGTREWESKWAKLNTDGEIVWGPDPELTPEGIEQAHDVNAMWKSQLADGIPRPEAVYSSPFWRSVKTCIISLDGWYYSDTLTGESPPGPLILEDLKETNGVHTCDMRGPRSALKAKFPTVRIEAGDTEEDILWTPNHRETNPEHDIRSKRAIERILSEPGKVISVSSHSGTMSSIFRVIGHKIYRAPPGGVVPVVLKVTKLDTQENTVVKDTEAL